MVVLGAGRPKPRKGKLKDLLGIVGGAVGGGVRIVRRTAQGEVVDG